MWPLPNVNGCSPKILEASRRDVVIGYDGRVALPRFVPVFAVRDGAIIYAGKAPNGRKASPRPVVRCSAEPG